MNSEIISKVKSKFRETFKEEPIIVRSPGRINLIGEHTDYNDGLVLPGAIDKSTYFAMSKSGSKECRLVSLDLNDTYDFTINKIEKSIKVWPDYILGVLNELQIEGIELNEGINCVYSGDIPMGAGMSSSASVECGVAFGLNHLFDLQLDRKQLARICQRAENNFVGVSSGIMDQFSSLLGEERTVLCIDCRSLEYEKIPFDYPDISIVLCDSGVKHSLASSEYNTRRNECEEGVAKIHEKYPEVSSLRDTGLEMLDSVRDSIPDAVYRRCHYVLCEMKRVEDAVKALKENDIESFGNLMDETHEGLSDKYEVSCLELDLLVDYTYEMDYVHGARMMGGGFGGCTINLVNTEDLDEFCNTMTGRYKQDTGKNLKIYINQITSGVEILEG